jgi:methylmalonyl-CoA mutase
MDPMGQLAETGWFTTKDKNNFDSLNLLSAVPDSSIISIDATLYQNAELTWYSSLPILAHANEYFNRIRLSINQ